MITWTAKVWDRDQKVKAAAVASGSSSLLTRVEVCPGDLVVGEWNTEAVVWLCLSGGGRFSGSNICNGRFLVLVDTDYESGTVEDMLPSMLRVVVFRGGEEVVGT